MVWARHTPRQPLQSHMSGHLGGFATQWSAEEMPDGQHQRLDIPPYARTAHKSLLKKDWKICAESSVMYPQTDPIGQGTEQN